MNEDTIEDVKDPSVEQDEGDITPTVEDLAVNLEADQSEISDRIAQIEALQKSEEWDTLSHDQKVAVSTLLASARTFRDALTGTLSFL